MSGYKKIGELHSGVTRHGDEYWYGEVWIDGAYLRINVFPNRRKRGRKQPALILTADESDVDRIENEILGLVDPLEGLEYDSYDPDEIPF